MKALLAATLIVATAYVADALPVDSTQQVQTGKHVVAEQLSDNAAYVTVIPHESELNALQAARATGQGTVYYLKGNGKRDYTIHTTKGTYTLDPNNAFTEEGIRKDIQEKHGKMDKKTVQEIIASAKTVSADLEGKIFDGRPILALHQDSQGGYGINSYLNDPYFSQFAEDVYVNEKQDPDDFAYVTDRTFFEGFKRQGINVILQKNEACPDDGSLSYVAAQRGIPYVNIEVESGKSTKQTEMVRAFNALLQDNLAAQEKTFTEVFVNR
ncbi:MAG: hypothetical protein V1725_00870 [archaeon]